MTVYRYNIYLCFRSIIEGMMYKTRSVRWTLKRIPNGRFSLMAWTPIWANGRGPFVTLTFRTIGIYRGY